MVDNKSTYSSLMNELVDVINEKAGSSGSKVLSELVKIAKHIIKPNGIKIINSNGNYNVNDFEFVEVNVPSGIVPSGNLIIKENGNYDVTQYATVSVATPVCEGETRSLKKLFDTTQSCEKLCSSNTKITDMSFFEYSDTSNVTNMSSMFYYCNKLTKISQMDTSNVTDMTSMLYGTAIVILPEMNTNKVKKFYRMCYGCSSLKTVEGLNMISATDASNNSGIFNNCTNLTNLTLYNIKVSLTIGSGSTYGHLLTIESLLNTCQECINVNANRTLTVGSANITKLSSVYVKLTGEPEVDSTLPKLPMVQCESTDEGAMLIADYMALKQWSLA